MRTNFILSICAVVIVLIAGSCKKEETGSDTKAVFSYVADGFQVNFTNFSRNATEYIWEFNDGSNETSTKKYPQHVFKSKGKFLVTLTAKNGNESSVFSDTVTILGPNIKIDGDFKDWENVSYSHTNAASAGGNLLAMKTFATDNSINFYLEGTTDMKMEIFDLYLDVDNNTATGFNTWQYPMGSGSEFLLEGSFKDGWGDMFKHTGAPTEFAFTPVASFSDVLSYSQIKTVGGKNIIEFSVKRSKLGTNLKGFVNYSITELTSGWAAVGSLPTFQTPTSAFGKIAL
ncbi:PKD domain-containing protein [Desertivirga arenae]|uniref:PKD domain-containing protein n=1 Tax=Desertivirga arenae TaxID=2810309 RepID=UPI001A969B7F|nr:PKD domain-containing protein [Pedobacter sp. SYSU D00823]